MNLQVISSPDGTILWVAGPLPGSTHDLTAARTWGIIRELAAAGLIVLADKGYHGAGDPLLTPYRGRNKPASQKDANRAHAQHRAPGERANAQLKTWHIRCSCHGDRGRRDPGRRLLDGRNRALAIRELYQNALDACRYRQARTEYLQHITQTHHVWQGQIYFEQGIDESGDRISIALTTELE